ncbi:MAG: polysaccharide pyruvyl transferase family protein [Actinomycetota bacterium]|nr:polysaccharide pyruvyl transferase family protein [Actinomycetota bacterium]
MKRFSVIAATVWGNRGAEAMLETTIGRLRDRMPDAEFAVFSYYQDRDVQLVSAPDVRVYSASPLHLVLVLFPWSVLLGLLRVLHLPYRWGPESVRALATSDALIDLAGVSFIDGREKFLPYNVLTILPAMLLGVPVFKLAQALGPFASPVNRFAARILWRCAMIAPRGSVTVENLAAIGYPGELTLPSPDVAFLFESRDSLSDEGRPEVAAITTNIGRLVARGFETVGVCPSAVIASKAVADGWDYPGFMAEIVRGILETGRAVVLFPNATRASSNMMRNNDLPVIAQIMERFDDAEALPLLAVSGDVNAAGLREIVSRCSCVAVSRFHAMVAALSASVPVAVLGWSHKYLEVMRQFGQERYVFDAGDHEAGPFLERLTELCGRRDEAAKEIGDAFPSVAEGSGRQFDEVVRRLEDCRA